MNPWYDKKNNERTNQLVGRSQNTAFSLIEPDAPGMTADSFPTTSSIFFGPAAGEVFSLVPKAEVKETRNLAKNPEAMERIGSHKVSSGQQIADLMNELAAKHPVKPEAAEGTPLLPVMPDLLQALAIAASDTRGVLVSVHPAGGGEDLDRRLAPIVFKEGFAGRVHLARMTAEEWARAKQSGMITGGSLESGYVLVAPDVFGLDGAVFAEVAAEAVELEKDLFAALERFHGEWRKPDRSTQLFEGRLQGITWTEFRPRDGKVEKMVVTEALEVPEGWKDKKPDDTP